MNALRNDKQNEWINVFFGNVYMEYKDYESAIACFERLVNIKPENHDYYEMLLDAAVISMKDEKALEALALMTSKFGTNKYTLNKRYEYYENKEDYDQSKKVLEEIVALYPKDIRYLKFLALTYQSLGDSINADATFNKILEIDPNDSDANLALLKDFEDPNEQNHYLRALSPIIENQQISIDTKVKELIPYTLQLQENHNDKELQNSLLLLGEKLTLTHIQDAKAHAYYGDVLYIAGQYEKAKVQYEKTLDINKKVYQVWTQYFYTLVILKDFKTLKEISNKALDYYPNQPLPYAYLGLCQVMDGNYKAAEKELEEAKFIAGNNPLFLSEIYTIKALSEAKQGNLSVANEICDHALKLIPTNTFALKTKAKLYEMDNDDANALIFYKKANEAGDKSSEVLSILNENIQ
jgi:tetratricopeptide (TPR) repeat protein